MKKSVNRWITLCFAVMLLLTLLVSAGWNLYSTRQSILTREEASARSCVSIVTGMLDHYGTDAVFNDLDEALFNQLWNSVRAFCEGFQQNRMILYRIDPDTHGTARYLEVISEDSESQVVIYGEGPGTGKDIPAEILKQILTADRDRFVRQRIGKEILWYVLYQDKKDSEPVIICMEYSIGEEEGLIVRNFLMNILLPVAALIISFHVLLVLVKKRITRPLRKISDNMKRFAQDSRHKPEPLQIPCRDEIGEIAGSFEKMTEDISTYVNNIETLTKEKTESDVQMNIARKIQYGLVPERLVLDGEGFRVRAMTRPAKAVGGDFYDCFRREDQSLCFFIGDVSGKSVTAAIFMAMTKTTIREKMRAGLSPAEALNRTNDDMVAQNPEGLFATVFAAVLNPETGELCYANAGHTLPIWLKKDSKFMAPDTGIALGLFEDAKIRNETLQLGPGEGILVYTDGVTESVNPQNAFFGEKRLMEAVKNLPDTENAAEETILNLSRAVGVFCDGSEPFDDMAVLVLTRNRADEPYGDGMHTLPVSLASFEEIKKAAFEAAGETPAVRKALLACDEALANIVHYSGAKELAFSCRKEDENLIVAFRDDGIPFDPTAEQTEEKEFEDLDSGGMGLNIIRQTAVSIQYERTGDRNIFSMVFRV